MKQLKFFLAIFVLILGLVLTFSPILKNTILDKKVHSLMEQIDTMDNVALEGNRKKVEAVEEVNELPSELDVLKGLSHKGEPVAFMYIPSTGLKLPIYKTVTKQNLLHGAGEMKEYNKLGKGNYVLAGHRMKKKGLLFHDVVRLNNGDKVYVTDKKKIYEYQVVHKQIIKENETTIMEENGKDEITLITCDIPSEPENRVAVSGDLINFFPFNEDFKNIE